MFEVCSFEKKSLVDIGIRVVVVFLPILNGEIFGKTGRLFQRVLISFRVR